MRESQVTFIRSELLGGIPGVVHGFSTRRNEGNQFSLGPVSSPNPLIQINRVRFLAAIGAPGWPILKLRQTHSGTVRHMIDTSAASEPVEGDASVTSIHGASLGVQTADCVPILIADSSGTCASAIHAGWRGTAARIAETTVACAVKEFGIEPSALLAAIGPHIGVCCYEVGPDVVQAIADQSAFENRREWAKPHLNLAAANRNQLLEAGLEPGRIETAALCTRCRSDLFFSYRRDGDSTGRMLPVIGLGL